MKIWINGFEKEISKTTIQLSGHTMLFPRSPGTMWQKDQEHLEKQDIVETIAPFISAEALISHKKRTLPISFEGTTIKGKNHLEFSILAFPLIFLISGIFSM